MGFDAVPEPLKKSSSVLRDPLTGVRIISGHNNNVYREEWRRGANHGGVCICKRCTCDKQKAIRCPCRCHEQVKYVSRRRLAYADDTVVRLRTNWWASSRSAGSRVPSGMRPSRISSRMRSASSW